MELLHMKIFELFFDTILDFLRFHAHKTGWGFKIPRQGYPHPHPLFLTSKATCYLDR